MRKTEWSLHRSGGEACNSGAEPGTAAIVIGGTTAEADTATAGATKCAAAGSSMGWMLHVLAAGARRQWPTGSQQPCDALNWKYCEQETHPPHNSTAVSSSERAKWAAVRSTV